MDTKLEVTCSVPFALTGNGSAPSAPVGCSLSSQQADLLDIDEHMEQICCMEVPFCYISARNYICDVARSLQGAL